MFKSSVPGIDDILLLHCKCLIQTALAKEEPSFWKDKQLVLSFLFIFLQSICSEIEVKAKMSSLKTIDFSLRG